MTTDPSGSGARLRIVFRRMALAAAMLTFVVIVASAIMRHTQAGLACADWPACYGRMEASGGEALPSTAVRLVRIAHRLAATSVLALVIGMLLVAWTQKPAWKREGGVALAALFVAAALAVLGLATPGAKVPAVTLGNLLGGYLMLALLSAVAARSSAATDPRAASNAPRGALGCAVLVLVFLQAASGAMIGAQYTLTTCPLLAGCPAFSFGDLLSAGALDPFRTVSIVEGRVAPPAGAAGLHVVHRALAIAAVVATIALASRWLRSDWRAAMLLVALAALAPLLGATATANMPSAPMTVLHNAAAALLVATLAYLAARTTPNSVYFPALRV